MARDAVFTSFFIFMVTRNIHLPWKKRQAVQAQAPQFELVSENPGEVKPEVGGCCCGKNGAVQSASPGKESDGNADALQKEGSQGYGVLPGTA